MFSTPGDFKLSPDGFSFQRNGDRKQERTLGVGVLGQNIASLHFKTERVAETALCAGWF